MVITVILISAAVILLLAALFIPFDAGIEYMLKQGTARAYIHIRLFGVIPVKIPLNTEKKNKVQEENDDKTEKKELDAAKFIKLTGRIKEVYSLTKDDIKQIARKIRKEITFKEIYFDVLFSTGNAAQTGIMTGTVWTASTFLTKLIDEIFGIKKVNVNVTPYFEGKCFNIHIKSILRLKAVNIIIIIFDIMKIIKIFKEKISNK